VTYAYAIPIPFNLQAHELVLEPHTADSDIGVEMMRIVDDTSWHDEEELLRLFRSVVLLKAANPEASLGACLHTAQIWERG